MKLPVSVILSILSQYLFFLLKVHTLAGEGVGLTSASFASRDSPGSMTWEKGSRDLSCCSGAWLRYCLSIFLLGTVEGFLEPWCNSGSALKCKKAPGAVQGEIIQGVSHHTACKDLTLNHHFSTPGMRNQSLLPISNHNSCLGLLLFGKLHILKPQCELLHLHIFLASTSTSA